MNKQKNTTEKREITWEHVVVGFYFVLVLPFLLAAYPFGLIGRWIKDRQNNH